VSPSAFFLTKPPDRTDAYSGLRQLQHAQGVAEKVVLIGFVAAELAPQEKSVHRSVVNGKSAFFEVLSRAAV
jgi:hypothetical protein